MRAAARECMRVTAGVPVQQMNILIRRPFHSQKPGDCTLIAFYPYPLYPITGLSVFISVILRFSLPCSFNVSFEPSSRSDRFYCVHYLTEKVL